MELSKLTEEQEQEAKNKFLTHGQGIRMGSYTTGDAYYWADLIDPNKFSMSDIRNKAISTAQRVNAIVDDPIFGKNDVAFTFTTPKEDVISFTYTDIYLFLRAAYRERMETADYLEAKDKFQKAQNYLEANKTKTERKKEAAKELKNLQKKYGFETA